MKRCLGLIEDLKEVMLLGLRRRLVRRPWFPQQRPLPLLE